MRPQGYAENCTHGPAPYVSSRNGVEEQLFVIGVCEDRYSQFSHSPENCRTSHVQIKPSTYQ